MIAESSNGEKQPTDKIEFLLLQSIIGGHGQNVVNANGHYKSIIAWAKSASLDTEQQLAFHIMCASYVLTFQEELLFDKADNRRNINENIQHLKCLTRCDKYEDGRPVRLFVTGPAGSGKSKLIDEVMSYCRQYSNNMNHEFTRHTIRLTALTGAAATEIGGETTAREFDLTLSRPQLKEKLGSFYDTRLVIVDEVSFADYDQVLSKLSLHLQQFTQCHDYLYGSVAMCFLGDFRQLEPIGGNSAYKHEEGMYWEQALTSMIELKGTHRFQNCPILKKILPQLRDTGLSEEARNELNRRVRKLRLLFSSCLLK